MRFHHKIEINWRATGPHVRLAWTRRFVALGVFVAGLLATGANTPANAGGLPKPPVIEATITERKIESAVNAEGFTRWEEQENKTGGPFSRRVAEAGSGDLGTTVSSSASQSTYISSFSIRGKGGGEAEANVAALGWARVDGVSSLLIQFMIPVDHPFTLDGVLDAFHVGEASGGVSFYMTWWDVSTGNLETYYKESASNSIEHDGEVQLERNGQIQAHMPVTIQIGGGGSVPQPAEGTMLAGATFEFDFDLGDRDGDGLLDDWETDGIDIDGDGTLEIDLPSYGADPDKKDIFVEIDVMAGVAFGQPATDAMTDVIEAFADAPASMVGNPSGVGGINLHVEWDDGDHPQTSANDAVLSGNGFPTQFDDIKKASFGSQANRQWTGSSGETWEADFRPIRLMVYRYCLWSQDEILNGRRISGYAEITGNDFVVAGGYIARHWSSVLRDTLAGTFMHELGHTLSLLHGGKGPPEQRSITYKPNYQSVMSYAYQYPRDKMTRNGSNAKHFWSLDYSRKAYNTLNENQLKESVGVDGTPGRFIIYNSAPGGQPPILTIANAIATQIDWDGDRALPDPDPVQRDISRFRATTPVEYQDELVSYRDWDELWYHQSGDDDFADGASRDEDVMQPNISIEEEMEILANEWVDTTGDSDVIFTDDAEYGDTSGWTMTIPATP